MGTVERVDVHSMFIPHGGSPPMSSIITLMISSARRTAALSSVYKSAHLRAERAATYAAVMSHMSSSGLVVWSVNRGTCSQATASVGHVARPSEHERTAPLPAPPPNTHTYDAHLHILGVIEMVHVPRLQHLRVPGPVCVCVCGGHYNDGSMR